MKINNLRLLCLFFLIFLSALPAAGEDDELPVILVDHRLNYMCGDTFELTFPDVPSSGSMFTNAGQIQATADKDKTLLQVRVRIRNMTTSVFHGIDENSFTLTGYVRDRSINYKPMIFLNTDYFSQGNYYNWDSLPPLRVADVLLVFRVNPILINWELSFEPKYTMEPDFLLEHVTYNASYAAPCAGRFLFSSSKNLETGAVMNFVR